MDGCNTCIHTCMYVHYAYLPTHITDTYNTHIIIYEFLHVSKGVWMSYTYSFIHAYIHLSINQYKHLCLHPFIHAYSLKYLCLTYIHIIPYRYM